MVGLEIQAQVGSVSSKHLEDFSTSLRNGFTSQRRKPPCLQHPEPTPIFGTSHPDFKLQIRPTSCSHDLFHTQRKLTQCRYLRKVRQASTYIQPGLQLSSCHHAQHVKAYRRQHFAVHSRRNCYNHDSPPKGGHNQPTRFRHTVMRFSLHYPMQLHPTLGKATHFYKSCLKRKSAAFETLMTDTFESHRT
jgi:hypothetical protein